MKPLFALCFLCFMTVIPLRAQMGQGMGSFDTRPHASLCISPEQRKLVDSVNEVNRIRLHLQAPPRSLGPAVHTYFNFPMVYTRTDCRFYNVTNYVDEDSTTGNIKDYRCGQITYDGHNGTDLAIWPYDFYKMDDTLVSIVAAQDGIIINSADGNFDRDCAQGSQLANYVILQHSDASVSWYWHMKKGTVTTLPIGTHVSSGTHLGYVGSSGSSTAPHLHFEVHNSLNAVIDPFDTTVANCNHYNTSSWWNSQIPYYQAGMAKVLVNKNIEVFNPCPQTSYPVSTQCFYPSDTLYIYLFGYNSSNNAPTLTLTEPNGTVYYTGTGGPSSYIDWYYYYYFLLPGNRPNGTWTASGTINGQTCSTSFYMNPIGATINASICSDSSYNFNGVNLNTSGVYHDTLTGSSGCDSIVTLALTVTSASGPDGGTGTWTWTGTMNSNWFTRCNWDRGSLPDANSDVVVPGGTTYEPTIAGATGYCKTISINTTSGGLLTVATSSSGLLSVAH